MDIAGDRAAPTPDVGKNYPMASTAPRQIRPDQVNARALATVIQGLTGATTAHPRQINIEIDRGMIQ